MLTLDGAQKSIWCLLTSDELSHLSMSEAFLTLACVSYWDLTMKGINLGKKLHIEEAEINLVVCLVKVTSLEHMTGWDQLQL